MAISTLLEPLNFVASVGIALISIAIYRGYLHPLKHIPGPLKAKVSSYWLYRISYHGNEASEIEALHQKYGPVVRIAPNEVDISDGSAINAIYTKNGGFLKSPYYVNFDIDGFHTLFSALEPSHRAVRSKAVVSMFAPSNIRDGKDRILSSVQRMVARMQKEKEESKGRPVNMLNITRSLAIDAVTSYLFDRSYNAIGESKLSADKFVDSFVAVGRFFYLPPWLFSLLGMYQSRMEEFKPEYYHSIASVDKFASTTVDQARKANDKDGQTYQARLLAAGISREETIAQCKDLMFAGADSTGMNMATIIRYLALQPEMYSKLREEITRHAGADPQTLPYLSGVIKEGLRLSMANPTRLPRVVPATGLQVSGLPSIPAGTSVGVSAFSVHLNEKVFEDVHAFKPERWSSPSEEMMRDFFAWGAGPRQCIARNLATAEMYYAIHALVDANVLEGAKAVQDEIKILEWFNSKVIDEKIELTWPAT